MRDLVKYNKIKRYLWLAIIFIADEYLYKSNILFALDCKHLYEAGYREDGVYTIEPDEGGEFEVYCELNPHRTDGTDEAGWTIFQRRVDDSVIFYR